ncbi:MAG: hypothetical protein U9N85_11655 [Bacteroidota bacterium]|nr:hypothetical protein [Bacteroidota bacterium]
MSKSKINWITDLLFFIIISLIVAFVVFGPNEITKPTEQNTAEDNNIAEKTLQGFLYSAKVQNSE